MAIIQTALWGVNCWDLVLLDQPLVVCAVCALGFLSFFHPLKAVLDKDGKWWVNVKVDSFNSMKETEMERSGKAE